MLKDGKLSHSGVKVVQSARKCPKCGKKYYDYPALSREDNKTEICSECGIREALATFSKTVVEKT